MASVSRATSSMSSSGVRPSEPEQLVVARLRERVVVQLVDEPRRQLGQPLAPVDRLRLELEPDGGREPGRSARSPSRRCRAAGVPSPGRSRTPPRARPCRGPAGGGPGGCRGPARRGRGCRSCWSRWSACRPRVRRRGPGSGARARRPRRGSSPSAGGTACPGAATARRRPSRRCAARRTPRPTTCRRARTPSAPCSEDDPRPRSAPPLFPAWVGDCQRCASDSMIVTLACPPPSHMVCRP